MPMTMSEPKPTPNVPREDPTSLIPKKLARARPLFDPEIVGRAASASFGKLNPLTLYKNPVMFVVEVGAALTTVFLVRDIFTGAGGIGFALQIALWLWFTVLFANFAEAMAEARGKGPGRQPAQDQDRRAGPAGRRVGESRAGSRLGAAGRRYSPVRRGRTDPRRWRSHRGHRHGR